MHAEPDVIELACLHADGTSMVNLADVIRRRAAATPNAVAARRWPGKVAPMADPVATPVPRRTRPARLGWVMDNPAFDGKQAMQYIANVMAIAESFSSRERLSRPPIVEIRVG